ncbi:MAG: anthranilate phosphoribosyltransferase [Alphaproteobacteria bacterium]|nr:anthranilate phosphoribosyltransferase [Alphaproteobacteria bacterium]
MTNPSLPENDLRPYLDIVAAGRSLDQDQARQAFEIIMSGNATPAQLGGFLMALRIRGESVDELTGAARVLRDKALHIDAPDGAIDTCGTGGDAKGTLNISTGATFVIAACGVPVAKHGNRALSSKSGAADVLTALGIDIEADMSLVRESLWENGIGFLMAPRHHVATANVSGARVELGTRTIFNLLGPLSSPAEVKRQIIGVFAPEWVEPLAAVLGELGSDRAWVMHGDGMDELTTTGTTSVAELKDGAVRCFEVTPEDAGLPRATLEDLKGGDPEYNAGALKDMLEGAKGPYRDIVALNAAAALVVAEKADDLAAATRMAEQAIDNGLALERMQRMIEITTRGVTEVPPHDG